MPSVRESLQGTLKGTTQSTVEKWTQTISAYEREFAPWEKRGDKILRRYRDDSKMETVKTARFNILWSNVQTLKPAVFSRIPQADVSRRFKDNDPVGRVASLILERALSYEIEHYPDFRETLNACVMDRFLPGRGTSWIRYEPHFRAGQLNLPEDGVSISEDADEPDEELDYECAPSDYVHWRDFGHTVARTWEEKTAVWRRVYLDKEAAVKRFGKEVAAKLAFNETPEELSKSRANGLTAVPKSAEIYEIWDQSELKAIWISKSVPEPLDERDDPLGLEGFFPCPKPLYATITNESLIPTPDFALYQDQARELDTLATRIDGLIQSLQIKGVYDAEQTALARIFTEGNNGTLIPVKNWAAFAEKNGLAGTIDLVDLKPIYEALRVCFDAVQGVLKQIYDLTGLSDIVRGQSDANETATAQRIKGQYASLRLKSMQTDVARFASENLQLKAQVICGKFDPKTILTIAAVDQMEQSDLQYVEQALQLLMGDRLADPDAEQGANPIRTFRIEVNADSMVEIDQQEEKENWTEFIAAQAQFMEKALPMAQASPVIAPLVATLWKRSVTAFKVGKVIEGEFDRVIDELTKIAQQPQQPKPDHEMERVKADAEIQRQRVAADSQNAQAKAQADQAKYAADLNFEKQKLYMESQANQQEARMQQMFDQQQAANEAAFKRWEALLKTQTQIEVAEISAEATATVAQANAARQATQGAQGAAAA